MMSKLTSLLLFDFLAKLTPVQRFEAAKNLSYSSVTSRWFLILTGITILVLIALFILVTFYRKKYEERVSLNIFSNYAEERGLSAGQKNLLLDISKKAGLKRKEAIFNLPVEFERTASQLITETLSSEGTEKAAALRKELFEIRRKLGFNTYFTKNGALLKSSRMSSRKLEEGKEVYLTSLEKSSIENIRSNVVENTEMELKIKPSVLIDTSPGKQWRISYNFGAGIWEFDATVFDTESGLITFDHTSEIRYINRRRFLRTRINKPALIADFPFSRKITAKREQDSESGEENKNPETGVPAEKPDNINPPDFISATVTELAGPGLKIETDKNIDIGQRLLIVFEMEKTGNPKDDDNDRTDIDTMLIQDVGMVEEIAEVKREEVNSGNKVIAVELVGLNDREIDDLVKTTNEAAIKNSFEEDNENRQSEEETASSVNS